MLTRTNLPSPKIVFKNTENFLILKKNEIFEQKIKQLENEIVLFEDKYLKLTDNEKLSYYQKKIELRDLKIDSIINLKYLNKTFYVNEKINQNVNIIKTIKDNKQFVKELAAERDEINLLTYEENIKIIKRRMK